MGLKAALRIISFFFLTQMKANLHCKERKIQPTPARPARGGDKGPDQTDQTKEKKEKRKKQDTGNPRKPEANPGETRGPPKRPGQPPQCTSNPTFATRTHQFQTSPLARFSLRGRWRITNCCKSPEIGKLHYYLVGCKAKVSKN
jgi:hypothetical protein